MWVLKGSFKWADRFSAAYQIEISGTKPGWIWILPEQIFITAYYFGARKKNGPIIIKPNDIKASFRSSFTPPSQEKERANFTAQGANTGPMKL